MYKFISVIIQLVLLVILSLFIITNSFIISFELNDFIYSISSPYIFIVFLTFFLFIFILQSFYFKTRLRFSNFKNNKFIKNKEKGYNSFVEGMIALSNKDYKKAISESKKISKYLDDSPSLSLLLKSEIYKIEKKYDELNLVYEEMIKNKSTQNLAFKGMMEQYLRSQDYHHAFIYGEKLFNNNPYIEKIYEALVSIIGKTNNWHQLIILSEKAYSKKIIEKKVFYENKSIALYEIAKIKQFSEIKQSIECVENALKLRKFFPPYVKFYLELLIQNKNYDYAKKYLKKIWNENAHPEYKTIIKNLAKHLKLDILEFSKFIIGSGINSENSKILMVESSIEIKNWDLARNHIKELLDVQPKNEVCLLMAKIEEGDTGDIQKVKSWNLRSKNGTPKNIWVCLISKNPQNEWSSVSNAGHFNSLEWRQPYVLDQYINPDISLFYENK